MKVRKCVVILTAVIMVFGILACAGSTGGEEAQGGISGKVINLSGGDSSAGSGGGGGNLEVNGQGEKGVLIRGGSVDSASFYIPQYTKVVNLGNHGWEVDADTAVAVYSVGSEPASPEYHFHEGNGNLYYGDGGATVVDTIVTGIHVKRGKTLTLGLNYDTNGNGCYDQALLYLSNDMDIDGTLKVEDLTTNPGCDPVTGTPEQRHGTNATSLDMGSLSIDPSRMYVGPRGLVTTRGEDAATADTRGGDGGYIYIWADDGLFLEGTILAGGGDGLGAGDGGDAARSAGGWVEAAVDLETDGPLVSNGDIDASGGDGGTTGDGGAAAPITLWTSSFLVNKGDLNASGGDGDATTGYGGNAGRVELLSVSASVFNGGALLSNGGLGGAGGGDGNNVDLRGGSYLPYYYYGYGTNEASVINSGLLEVKGGDALSSGDGGDAGMISAYTYGGEIKSTGCIEASGGNGVGVSSDGGNGGVMRFKSGGVSMGYPVLQINLPGDVVIANNITAVGGSGLNSGGNGGRLYARTYVPYYSYYYYVPFPLPVEGDSPQVELVGFSKVMLNGGDGQNSGGWGGSVMARSSDVFTYAYGSINPQRSAGPVINNVIIEANGGDSTNGNGGGGGSAFFGSYGVFTNQYAEVVNKGRLELNGGTVAGGGYAYLLSAGDVTNSGAIIANGGDDDGAPANGGGGGEIYLASLKDVINNDILSTNGGYGTVNGGGGGNVSINAAEQVRNSGALRAKGGDSGTSGGGGGDIDLSSASIPTRNSGSGDVRGGTPGGAIGSIFIDDADVTPLDGTLGF